MTLIIITASARCPSCGGGTGPGPWADADRWAQSHTKRTGHMTVTTAVPERRQTAQERGTGR